jgi:hypothetical protein
MKNETQNTSNEAKLAMAAFALSAICLAAALIGPHGLLTSAPTLGGAGSIVGAVAFFLLGVHFRKSAKVSNETSVNSDET